MDKRYRETALGGLAADYERSLQQTPQLHFVQDLCGFMKIKMKIECEVEDVECFFNLYMEIGAHHCAIHQRIELQAFMGSKWPVHWNT